MVKKDLFRKISLILLGTFIISVSLNALYIPNNILSGGVTGLAMIFHIIFGWNISVVIIAVNIPLFILAYKYINKTFILFSLVGMFSLSFFLKITENFIIETDSIITVIVLGGALYGIGLGIVFKENGSCGGNDILVKILYKYMSFSMGLSSLIINIFIIGLSAHFFGIDLTIYTLCAIYICGQVVNFVVEGFDKKRTAHIISNQPEAISAAIMKDLQRGVTFLQAEGAYTGDPKKVIFCTIGVRQVSKLKSIVAEIDHDAFLTVTETAHVIGGFGKGFKNIDEDD